MDDSHGRSSQLLIGEQNIGEISTLGEPCEPFGELSFFKMIDVFYDKAYALSEEGCELFLLEGMDSLAELRAAALACRRLEKPIVVLIDAKADESDSMGGSELAYLITLQQLGISAFGVKPTADCPSDEIAGLFGKLYPYAAVPLFARLQAGKVLFSEVRELINSGVEGFDCREITPAEREVVRIELEKAASDDKSGRKEDISFIAANEEQAFFLSPESMTFSPPIDVECDMSGELVDFEDEAYDCISLVISTHDDGFHFGQNMHFLTRPIMFSTDSAEVLRMALHYYNGRALVDSKCGIDEDTLSDIAGEFGAIIY